MKCFVQALIVVGAILADANAAKLHPIILVPGDGGSRLEAKLNKTAVVHYVCSKQSDWYNLWLNLEQMVPTVIDCWADNIRLVYDNVTHTTRNNDGVDVRVPGFGNSTYVEYLDPSLNSVSVYFAKVAQKLLLLGYQRDVNLHGAPYDFRKAANEHDKFFSDVKTLIESTYVKNGNTPVILICHSMGSIMTLYFLNRQSQAWKDKYIRGYVTMAGVWGGTVRAMKVFAVGDNLGAWIVSSKSLMIEQRTNPSLAWLMPNEDLWPDTEVLIQSPNVNITTKNMHEFFEGLGHPEAELMRKDVKDLIRPMTPPGVDTFCIHGAEVPTTQKMTYPSFPDSTPVLEKGDGDGTVNRRSLEYCTRWKDQQKQLFHHHVFPHVDHLEILRQDETTEYVKNIVQSLNTQYSQNWKRLPKIDIIG